MHTGFVRATAPLAAIVLVGCTTQPTTRGPDAWFAIVNGERVDVPDIPMGDADTINRIIQLGLNDNRVMEHLTYLCEEIGPRLTGSTNVENANLWIRDTYIQWGLDNPHVEEWGTIPVRFDRGLSLAEVVTQRTNTDDEGNQTVEYVIEREMQFTTLAWGPGTDGPVVGHVVRMPQTVVEYEAVEDRLGGAWVLIPAQRAAGQRRSRNRARAHHGQRLQARQRLAEGDLTAWPEPAPEPEITVIEYADAITGEWRGTMSGGPIPDGAPFVLTLERGDDVTGSIDFPGFEGAKITDAMFEEDTGALRFVWPMSMGDVNFSLFAHDSKLVGKAVSGDGETTFTVRGQRGATTAPADPMDPANAELAILDRVLLAGPAGFLSTSGDERVWTSSIGGWRSLDPAQTGGDAEAVISEPDYDYINSRLYDGAEVFVRIDANNVFTPGPIPVYNTIAEITGTEWPEQVVIVSGHLDSWNGVGSQGAIDNGTGTSVTMEAARLLMAAGAKPKRTIRFIHWTGEEQGLLGSRAYVEMHKEEIMANVSMCVVDDGGTNYEGGIQCIESMRDYLAAATAPINDVFYSEVDGQYLNVDVQVRQSMPRGGGSDHVSFNAIGVPGFFWNEVGRANYRRGWHTQFDRLDQAIPEYLRQSSTCAAVTAYNIACAPELLAREIKDEPAEGN
ncbi:MAG: M20/M25/M40 family metallo-hydrolase [Planctomycetes bacterium]|nr:M20/M25/M40 family metallo-hydrolase [Planctomycetota bacterium]